ncbi:MAG: acyl-CoA dehydratase activase-related protein [candidate division WOR-3 bacterium]
MPSVGIARSLHSYHHFTFWRAFFEALGWEVMLSGRTDRQTVEQGVKLAPAELCLPVKVFLGQVARLLEQAEYVFVPRLVCRQLRGDFYFGCPKAIALPDLVRAIFPQQKGRILELVIDQQTQRDEDGFVRCAKALGMDRQRAHRAFQQAKMAEAGKLRGQGASPADCFPPERLSLMREAGRGKIGVIGHPYLVYDEHISLGLLRMIAELEAVPVIPEVGEEELIQEAGRGRALNWYYELELIAGARKIVRDEQVDGLLLVSSFACGTAPVVNELIRREVAVRAGLPMLTLLFDEHSGETGLRTRLEAFGELIKARR